MEELRTHVEGVPGLQGGEESRRFRQERVSVVGVRFYERQEENERQWYPELCSTNIRDSVTYRHGRRWVLEDVHESHAENGRLYSRTARHSHTQGRGVSRSEYAQIQRRRKDDHIHWMEDRGTGSRSEVHSSQGLPMDDNSPRGRSFGNVLDPFVQTRSGVRPEQSCKWDDTLMCRGVWGSNSKSEAISSGKSSHHPTRDAKNIKTAAINKTGADRALIEERSASVCPRERTGDPTGGHHKVSTPPKPEPGPPKPHDGLPVTSTSCNEAQHTLSNEKAISFKNWTTQIFPSEYSKKCEIVRVNQYQGGFSFRNLDDGDGAVKGPPSVRFEGKLDPITVSTIDLEKLRILGDDTLRSYIDLLEDVEKFRQNLITQPETLQPGIRRGLSRKMIQHLSDLENWGVVRRTDSIKVVSGLFCVEKKNGLGRLISNGKKTQQDNESAPTHGITHNT
eukprot:PhF_6_TR2265/c1_g4_i3/m.3903